MQQQPKEYETTFLPKDFCPEIPEGPKIQAALDRLVSQFFPQEGSRPTPTSTPKVYGGAQAPSPVDDDDAELLAKARRSKNGDQFSRLFDHGDISGYPSHSEADQALANMLAFWCGPDAGRIDRLMRQSALLASPERLAKWDKVHVRGQAYGQSTVERALNGTTAHYDPQYGRTRKGPTRPAESADAGIVGSGDRPEIVYRAGELPQAVAELQAALKGKVYQMGGVLVKVIRLPQKNAHSPVRREAGTPVVVTLGPEELTLLAAQSARWVKFNTKGEEREINPPRDVVNAFLAASGQWTFPVLTGIASCPILRPDGSVLACEGFDPQTGLFADFGGQTFPAVALRPTKEDASAALEVLKDALREFPFVADADRSVALAATISTVVRRSVQAAPLFAISASTPGTGKSTLAELLGIISTGKRTPAMDFSADEGEFKKTLFSALLECPPTLLIDNVYGELNSSMLCAALTQETIKNRILGASKTAEIPTSTLIFATGNNLAISGDMVRRTLLCSMDAGMERPGERVFSREIYSWAHENRPRLVHAALTTLRAYHMAGKPGAQAMRKMNGFSAWSTWVRGPLLWLGEADPLDSQRALEDSDPEREALGAVLASWYECLRSQPVLVGELLRTDDASDARVQLYQSLVAAVVSPRGVNVRSLGKWLSKYQGRIVQGFRIVNCGTYKRAVLWKVEKVG